ncbi:hypothetical protein CC1G_14452 [Coprinopsis cinerea okayama7|uniref:Uncharacterized protein n=1 Tax=Coprinopsis cinerea (strain Okayama-7 / 130 / ATCC MYA-4618 / FGSC 9003) TaxID=240176 RepID=D6RLU6_COPC7|nr:hypothetical protein CC1G_14452 [Coprinopsis cinerea okayama7\|eukprot:XP_002911454.1 hypothetical protein CC1G_14452 [Coprinopsis cinerea okayama7\
MFKPHVGGNLERYTGSLTRNGIHSIQTLWDFHGHSVSSHLGLRHVHLWERNENPGPRVLIQAVLCCMKHTHTHAKTLRADPKFYMHVQREEEETGHE